MSNSNSIPTIIRTIDTHTGGDPTRIVISGLPEVPGKTMLEKKQYLIDHLDSIRTSLMLEPRGHKDMFGAVLLKPTMPEAAIGVVFMNNAGYLNMCGHGTIGVVTAIIENQLIAYDPEKPLILETPAGLVTVTPTLKGNKVVNVSIQNVPAFLWSQDVVVDVDGIGELTVDIAFGGSFFALVDVNSVGYDLIPKHHEEFSTMGMNILNTINNTIKVEHPLEKNFNKVELILFLDKSKDQSVNTQNVAIFGEGQVARSACGTGLSAQMATQSGKELLKKGDTFVTESIIKTAFHGKYSTVTTVGEFSAIIPEINGNAFITGRHEFILHPEDSLKYGFLLK